MTADDRVGLKGKVAIITGAGRGIGSSIALALTGAGASVTIVDIDEESLSRTAVLIREAGGQVLPITTDVTQESQVTSAVTEAVSRFGKIDILCNNAGIVIAKPVAFIPEMKIAPWLGTLGEPPGQTLTVAEWRRVLDTNLTGAFLFARAVAPHMMRQRHGKIINISSTSADKGTPYFAAYCASKAALSSLSRCLASEWAEFNINVNAIAPGTVDTDMTRPTLLNPERKRLYLDAIPLGRLADPQEIARLVIFLVSEAADYITGQTIVIDGGQLGRGPGV